MFGRHLAVKKSMPAVTASQQMKKAGIAISVVVNAQKLAYPIRIAYGASQHFSNTARAWSGPSDGKPSYFPIRKDIITPLHILNIECL